MISNDIMDYINGVLVEYKMEFDQHMNTIYDTLKQLRYPMPHRLLDFASKEEFVRNLLTEGLVRRKQTDSPEMYLG